MKKFELLAGLALVASVSCGSVLAAPVYGVLSMGMDFGGDEMLEVVYSNGDSNKVQAGDGLSIAGGIGISSDDKKYEGQFTIGWKYRGVSATNGDLSWTRYPLEALGYVNVDKLRFGGGISYHLNPKIKGSGALAGIDGSFDNALGYVLEAQYGVSDAIDVGGRFTVIDYEIDGFSINGNSFGLSMAFKFGR